MATTNREIAEPALDAKAAVPGGGDTESFFTFEPCVHGMVKPDCPSCLRGHASRLEHQLQKLEVSIALPIRERVEALIQENVAEWFGVWKSVPLDTKDWVKNAAHHLSWGIARDLPMTSALPSPDAAARARAIVESVTSKYGATYPSTNLVVKDIQNAVATALTASEAEVIERCVEIVRGGLPDSTREYREPIIAALQSLKGGKG